MSSAPNQIRVWPDYNDHTNPVSDDWDWVAAETWRAYPVIFNEFTINESLDFLLESAKL
jgi:hypothetical protein